VLASTSLPFPIGISGNYRQPCFSRYALPAGLRRNRTLPAILKPMSTFCRIGPGNEEADCKRPPYPVAGVAQEDLCAWSAL
jgi:hypothetical protein